MPERAKPKFPKVSLVFILLYHIIGAILILLPHGKPGMGGVDFPSLIIGYLGYILVILACIFFYKSGK